MSWRTYDTYLHSLKQDTVLCVVSAAAIAVVVRLTSLRLAHGQRQLYFDLDGEGRTRVHGARVVIKNAVENWAKTVLLTNKSKRKQQDLEDANHSLTNALNSHAITLQFEATFLLEFIQEMLDQDDIKY